MVNHIGLSLISEASSTKLEFKVLSKTDEAMHKTLVDTRTCVELFESEHYHLLSTIILDHSVGPLPLSFTVDI